MTSSSRPFTGPEKSFGEDEIIVSKTDLKGRITYVNDVFIRVSKYSERELVGAPHNLIRHPDMPRCVFKLLWDTIQQEREIFAYVLNLSADRQGYWVFAHVTPSFDPNRRHIGYHSNRRVPYPDAVKNVKGLYTELLDVERQHPNPREACEAGYARMVDLLAQNKTDYDQFVFGLSRFTRLESSVTS